MTDREGQPPSGLHQGITEEDTIRGNRSNASHLIQYVIFSIADQRYALPLSAVERIVLAVEITPLPEAPESVMGLINAGGQIIPVINICNYISRREIKLNDRLIIAHASERSAALLAETVSGVVEYPEEEVVAQEDLFPETGQVKGAIRIGDQLVLVLEPENILSFSGGAK